MLESNYQKLFNLGNQDTSDERKTSTSSQQDIDEEDGSIYWRCRVENSFFAERLVQLLNSMGNKPELKLRVSPSENRKTLSQRMDNYFKSELIKGNKERQVFKVTQTSESFLSLLKMTIYYQLIKIYVISTWTFLQSIKISMS